MLKKWFLVIFKAHSPLRQKNGIFKRDQTQNHACLTQTNDFIPYTNIYNQIIIWGPYLAISGHCAIVLSAGWGYSYFIYFMSNCPQVSMEDLFITSYINSLL